LVAAAVRQTFDAKRCRTWPARTPATPSEILRGVPDDLRGKLPDEVVDELLAEPGPRRRSSGRAGCSAS
jgi:hypothetical protein